MPHTELERVLSRDWHVVADATSLAGTSRPTRLFDAPLEVWRGADGVARVQRADDGAPLASAERYGFVWACPGEPERDIIDIPEASDPERHVLGGGSFGVHVSGLRAVENFLDMGHFPFVHTDYLGAEPHTEVAPYSVSADDDGITASECRFFQPVASPSADSGLLVDYVYKVFRPYTVALYKTNPAYATRRDFIALFIQPTREDACIVHTFLAYLRKGIDAPTVRWFMQLIFAQDKPILENQCPRRLPLDPHAETPVRADAASIGYRRWLRQQGVRYGAIPATAATPHQHGGGMNGATACRDPAVYDLWHVIGSIEELAPGRELRTRLLEEPLVYALTEAGPAAWRLAAGAREALPVRTAFGYLWTCLGEPRGELFSIPEYAEPDRRNLNAATVGVHVSAPRAIENFLDLGHFPFVHTDILGVEPHTEVKEYQVAFDADGEELVATGCRFYQPMAAAASSGGADVDYVYRVPHPYCSILYKSSGADPSRMDVIALFVQPVEPERARANMLLSLVDDQHTQTELRDFQLTIFGQDKPILENQMPKRLPLDPRAEVPIRADKSSVAYRRWLSDRGVSFGVIRC